jgi:putative ATPase
MASSSASLAECPVCQKFLQQNAIEEHIIKCFEEQSQRISSPANKKRQSDSGKNFGIFNCAAKKAKIQEDVVVVTLENDSRVAEKNQEKPEDTKTAKQPKPKPDPPLAEAMRAENFTDYVGQKQAVGENSIIRNLLKSNNIPSMIFWGPPGCGKTTLANIIFSHCNKEKENFRFVKLSACTCGINDVKDQVKQAKTFQETCRRRTILFMDEIHRFNKLQQDAFLPHVENGTIILLGATTENPSFSLNSALLSRCRVIVLEKLESSDILEILRRALPRFKAVEMTPESIKELKFSAELGITPECLQWIADISDGDARIALNSFEMCMKQAAATRGDSDGLYPIKLDDVKEGITKSHLLYDRAGDQHYDIISALHKSIRASDDNASLYWVTRMMLAGEDPKFICRRLIRAASEDIGLADPQALVLATSTLTAVQNVGMPESDCIIAQLAVYLARAPKSIESYAALGKCKDQIKNQKGAMPGVPIHLRNAPTKLMGQLGYGSGYNRLHKDESGLNYLPEELEGVDFFDD